MINSILMKRRFLTILTTVVILLAFVTNANAQAIGDYGSMAAGGTTGTMDWLTGTWYVCTTAGTWTGATTTNTPPDQTKNVWILAGDVVNLTSATFVQGKCNNLEVAGSLTLVDAKVENSQVFGNIHVASTGTITANPKFIWGNYSTSAMSLTVDAGGKFYLKDQFKPYGANGATTTITNNGILGAATAVAGSGATIYMINQSSAVGNSNVIFTGTGTTIFRRLLADTNAGSFNITFDQNVTFSPAATDPGIKLQNASGVTATSARSITINAGKTVTISSGWFANNATAFSGVDANNTYNINGILDASAASIYFGCTSNSTADQRGATNSQIINIGPTGTLKCGSAVNVNKPLAGQTLAVNVASGGTITYAGTAYQTFPVANTFTISSSPYALLTNNNSNLSFTSTSTTTLAVNANFTVDKNLTLGATTTLSGASNTTVNGTLSIAGKITNNTGNFVLGSNAVFSGSATNYIDLASGGSLTRNGVSTSSTLFPIGAGSYTPLTLANTTGTPNITAKVKTTIDNAVEDATKIVNLQWSVVGSASSTSDITFRFNGTNKASAFDAGTTCDLGNYTSVWTSSNVNTPAGLDPYTISAIGLAIPTTDNFYVIGNTGKVVRLAPTSTTWSGAIDADWANAANWSNGVPDNTLEAIIPASLSIYPVISTSQNIKNLTVASGASITNNDTLNIYGPAVSSNGTLGGNGVYTFAGAVVQTITGSFSVNNLTLNNNSGIVNNGLLTVNSALTVIAGSITGTAPVYSTDLPVTFTGSGTSASGLILNPSSGNVGTLNINGSGTLNMTAAGTTKNLLLTAGTLNNSSYNITVSESVTRIAGALATAPAYSGSIPVTYTGSSAINSGYEVAPASGSISVFTVNGTGTYTVVGSFSTTGDINVAAGTLKMSSNVSAQNITVASGAVLNSENTATSGARYTLTVGNGAAGNDAVMTVNGTLGNTTKWANDGIDIEISANTKTFTVNGIGNIGISGMRPAANANARTLDIVINSNMFFDRDNGGASNIEPALTLQNGTGTYARTLTIASGVIVAFRGNAGLHGQKNTSSSADESVSNYACSSSDQGNYSYIINGTLDLSYYAGSVFNLNTCTFAGNTQSVIVNVKNGGTLKLGNVVKMYTALAGQTADIVTESGSNVEFASTLAQTLLLTTGSGTLPALSLNKLTLNNSNGLALSKPINITGALVLTAGNITGNPVIMSGTTQQTITANGNSIENLTVNNDAGVQGSPNISGLLTITKGDILDYSNLSNVNILYNGTSAQTVNAGLTAVKNLTVNNAAGVSLTGSPTVNGTLTLTNGKLSLGNNNLTIWSTGSLSTPNTNSYIVTNGTGMLIMNAAASASTIFPVGTASSFHPVTVNPSLSANFYVSVNEGNTPALPATDATVLPAKSLNRTWNITPGIPVTATLTLGYNGSADANASFDNSGADVALLHNNTSGIWEYVGSGAVTPGIGTSTTKTATFEGISSFSPFTVVNPGPGAVYTNTSGGTFSDIFRSKAAGNWNGTDTWELYDATTTSWTSTVLSPSETSTATIQSGHVITLTSQAGIGNLTIESGATLKSSVSAYIASPIVLSIGKASSVIRNNGIFGCEIGSAAGTVGDGITLSLSPNVVSFSLQGTGNTGIGSLYAEASSNNLAVVIDQNVQFRRTTSSGKHTALSLIAPSGTAFTGSRTLVVSVGKTVSFLNEYSCLHGTAFSSAGSYSEQQGNITYDIQGILDLKGGNVYITSSSSAASAAQVVKINVCSAGKIIAGGDFNICKVQATQAVYVNMEDGALVDASDATVAKTSFFGPSTNSTNGYGANYSWIITNGTAKYKRWVGNTARVFNVAVTPADGDYVNMKANPVSIATTINQTDLYTVNVNAGHPYLITSFSESASINRSWTIKQEREVPLGTTLKFGFTGGTTDANAAYSPTYPAVSGSAETYETYAGTAIAAGATNLYVYNGLTGYWTSYNLIGSSTPVTGTFGTAWEVNFGVGTFFAPYLFTFRNTGAPLICQ